MLGCRVARRELEPVPKRWAKNGESVPTSARRARKVHDQRPPAKPGDPSREEGMGSPGECIRSDRFCNPRSLAIEHQSRRLGGHVPGRKSSASCCHYEQRGVGELQQRPGDVVDLVRQRLAARRRSRRSRRSSSRSAPLVSSRSPELTPSETVSTTAFTPLAPASSSRRAARPRSTYRSRSPLPCRTR